MSTLCSTPGARAEEDTLCALPWLNLFIAENGLIAPCCLTRESIGTCRDSDGRALSASHPGDIRKAWNSEEIRTLRAAMLRGERPIACSRCFMNEDLGIHSLRKNMNDSFSGHADHIRKTAPRSGLADPNLRAVDLRLGNVCNLKCRMCSPLSSRLLTTEFKTIFPERASHMDQGDPEWFRRDGWIEEILAFAPNLERVHLAGGEPLVIPQGIELLHKLVDLGLGPKIRLSYNTNLTVLPPAILALWTRFEAVDVRVSIDGFGRVNEYIRYPSRWKDIDENLRSLQALAAFRPFYFRIHTVIQAYNVMNFTDLLRYLSRFDGDQRYPEINFALSPPQFDVQVLPSELRKTAARRIMKYLRSHRKLPAAVAADYEGIIFRMLGQDKSDLFQEFARVTAAFDRARGQRLGDFIPDLASLELTR